MKKYFKKLRPTVQSSSSDLNQNVNKVPPASKEVIIEELVIDLENLPSDPRLRPNIMEYPPEKRDQVRRAYLLKGPCQPRNHNFPQTMDGNRKRRFIVSWFDDFKDWLEYSVEKDAAYCLHCYLFSADRERKHTNFVYEGFSAWRKKTGLREHVENHDSNHNKCRIACENLMNQSQSIESAFSRQLEKSKIEYWCRLNASIGCLRYLLMQGLPFQGNDESENSTNQGNFLELLKFIASNNEEIKNVVLGNAPENLKLISPDIQRDIINTAVFETTKAIVLDMGDDLFSILVDECRNVSVKEQMGVVIRYVDSFGCVIERFLGLVHIHDTSATSLLKGIKSLFSNYVLSIASLRGQGYDGASNMRGEFHGLKSLILKESFYVYYIHCFAHQLQLTLVAVAKKHLNVCSFFNTITRLCNVIGGSCKRRDMLREKQIEKVIAGILQGVMETGQGLNQEMTLKRPGDTRWGSHFGTLINLLHLFSSVIEVLEFVGENGKDDSQRAEAIDLIDIMLRFEFLFVLHLMIKILRITNGLSQVLQKKDQNIVNAMHLVKVSKFHLQQVRDDGWESLLKQVVDFCGENNVSVIDMQDMFIVRGRSRRRSEDMTNLHHYRVELFYYVIDMQLQELNNRFDEVNTSLLLCMACLDPKDSFSAFDMDKLIELAKFYPSEFPPIALIELEYQLGNFIMDVRTDKNFSELSGIGDLAKRMVATRKHHVFPLVYLLVKLSLLLPVATAIVERAFSAMKIIKSSLRNKMGDDLLNDCLVCYIERDVFANIDNDLVMKRFQSMKSRRGSL